MDTNRAIVARRPGVSLSILTVGGLAYAILCVPAIERRGYPPIDHVWMAMTYLWVAPLALSSLFDGGASTSRRWHLIAYAVLTGFVDAATAGGIVPRYVTFLGTLLMTIFLYGPAHLVVTFAIEWCLQRLLGRWRSFSPIETSIRWMPRLSLMECLIGYTIVALAVGFPFAYRERVIANHQGHGRRLADDDWSEQTARHFVGFMPNEEASVVNGALVSYEFDTTTGLALYKHGRLSDTSRAYNDRIDELLREHGVPSWSMRNALISPELLVAQMDSSEGTEINSFPFEVTPNIVVFKSGTVSKWGSTMTFNGNGGQITSTGSSPGGLYLGGSGLAIATQPDGLRAVGSGAHPVFVIQNDEDTILIRFGANWIGLFHRDGRLLESARR